MPDTAAGDLAAINAKLAAPVATNPAQASTVGDGVVTGGAQTLFGGTAPVNGWKIVNPNATGDFWVSDNGVAPTVNGASSYRCAAGGGSCKTEPGERPPGSALQLLGATIGAPFIARRW